MKEKKVKKPKEEPVQVIPQPEADKETTREIVKIIEKEVPTDAFGKLSRPQLELIKRTVAKDATDDELKLFIQVCAGARLNPFLRQVHFVKRWDSKANGYVGAIQVGIDGFRAIAESSGSYAGNDDPVFTGEELVKQEKGPDITVPSQATVSVYKLMGGQRYAFTATARWKEYYNDKQGFMWRKMPHTMLGKVAEALALRKAFPKLLSGLYAHEELDQAGGVAKKTPVFEQARQMIEKSKDPVSLSEFRDDKLPTSPKYTDEEKGQLKEILTAKIQELEKNIV